MKYCIERIKIYVCYRVFRKHKLTAVSFISGNNAQLSLYSLPGKSFSQYNISISTFPSFLLYQVSRVQSRNFRGAVRLTAAKGNTR